ncbi:precorrin-8X methylmutase [Dermacoccus sp. PE3]|uniref:precorrin-8X methylmutase n=1 Tax=Dermacoccus sp. PE3 TaxID=1641401 RepID=UPI000641D1D9|nr:precorrin-8X methylmutase [Dermacoccus sp. PE3]KLO61908.1 precorrin-8X methylmutase [Dermacoccus sp. PE3]
MTRLPTRRYPYERDGQAIYRESFATIRREADLSTLPESLHTAAVRIIHAAGDVDIAREIEGSPDVADAVHDALSAGASILTDSFMLANGVTRRRLPADNEVRCTLRDPAVPDLARQWRTTRSAAAVSLWEPWLDGAVVAIGNAPTALFHLLEVIADGGPRPAAIIGMPVGFVGSAESKIALSTFAPEGGPVPWLTVHGRRGGSAMAAATINALATRDELA